MQIGRRAGWARIAWFARSSTIRVAASGDDFDPVTGHVHHPSGHRRRLSINPKGQVVGDRRVRLGDFPAVDLSKSGRPADSTCNPVP